MENWLKLVEYEYLLKKTPYQIKRLKERFEDFKQQGNLDETLSPEEMAEIVLNFVKKEDEKKEAEREKEAERCNEMYSELIDKRIDDIKTSKPERPPKSLEYQLGFMIGDQIVDRYLITLSNERHTRNVIEISNEEQTEYDRLHNIWSDAYDRSKDNSKEEWKIYRDFAHSLQKKYLPAKLECFVGKIESVNNLEEVKEGIRHALWDSDSCCYDTTVIDIEDDIEDDLRSSKVTIYLEKTY